MASISITIRGDGLPKFEKAVKQLGSKRKAHTAYRRAVNEVGKSRWTGRQGALKSLTKQVGLKTQKKIIEKGNIKVQQANMSDLIFSINAQAGRISLKEFSPKQFGYGVRAAAWGRSQKFKSAFIFAGRPGSGILVGNGHVFKRTTSSSTPIEILHGPSIPKEMVEGGSAIAWEGGAKALQVRVHHHIKQMSKGVIT